MNDEDRELLSDLTAKFDLGTQTIIRRANYEIIEEHTDLISELIKDKLIGKPITVLLRNSIKRYG